jgi:uncharacterized protein (TIGR03085 family)
MDEYLRLFVQERLDLCALLSGLNDDEWRAATLDEGWTVEDLAAHIVVRERYPLDLTRDLIFRRPGEIEALMEREKARGHAALLASLRTMPTLFFRLPGPVARGNLGEAYIHNEDARRGSLQRQRSVSAELQLALWASLPVFARGLRRVPATGLLAIDWPGHERRVVPVGRGRRRPESSASATLSGEPGELLLWLSGRKAAAHVQLDGAGELAAAMRDAPLNI